MSSISFSDFSRKPSVQLTNKTSYKLQSKQVRQVCSIPGRDILIHGYPKGCGSSQFNPCFVNPMVGMPLTDLKTNLKLVKPDAVAQITALRTQLGYKPSDEQWLTLDYLSKDLQMVDEITRKPLARPLLESAKERVNSKMTFEKLTNEC